MGFMDVFDDEVAKKGGELSEKQQSDKKLTEIQNASAGLDNQTAQFRIGDIEPRMDSKDIETAKQANGVNVEAQFNPLTQAEFQNQVKPEEQHELEEVMEDGIDECQKVCESEIVTEDKQIVQNKFEKTSYNDEDTFNTILKMLEDVSRKVSNLDGAVCGIKTQVDGIQGKTSGMEQNVKEIKAEMSGIQGYGASVAQLKSSLSFYQQKEQQTYKDLEMLRKGERFTTIKPVLESLVSVHTELYNSNLDYEDDSGNVTDLEKQINKAVSDQLIFQMKNVEGLLQIQGVSLKWYGEDTPYNPTEQMITGKPVVTNDSGKKDTIVEAKTPCYIYGDKVLRKAKVVVYKVVQ